jgi:hypothetical protein
MFKRRRISKNILDAAAVEVTRSAGLTHRECDATVTSPLFLAQLRARIESDKSRGQAAQPRSTYPVLDIGKMKLAFSVIVIVAAVLFWLIRIPAMSGTVADAASDQSPALTACSISATSACAISIGDVLQLLLSNNIKELPK